MTNGLIGRKLGMTRVFSEDGVAVPVTIIQGHARKAGLEAAPHIVRSFELVGESLAPGSEVTVEIFAPGELVKVTGRSKGRGFQGIVHRYGAGGGPASHGNTRHRKPGSIGAGTDPSRVIKGKRMPGHMGDRRHTELGLKVVRIDAEKNLLFVRGAIPGARNGIVMVAKQGGRSRHD
jgi:large subunit ribosomal protein L3